LPTGQTDVAAGRKPHIDDKVINVEAVAQYACNGFAIQAKGVSLLPGPQADTAFMAKP